MNREHSEEVQQCLVDARRDKWVSVEALRSAKRPPEMTIPIPDAYASFGWLSPRGELYPCLAIEHHLLQYALEVQFWIPDLEKAGWIKLGGKEAFNYTQGRFYSPGIRPTKRQVNAITDWCLHYKQTCPDWALDPDRYYHSDVAADQIIARGAREEDVRRRQKVTELAESASRTRCRPEVRGIVSPHLEHFPELENKFCPQCQGRLDRKLKNGRWVVSYVTVYDPVENLAYLTDPGCAEAFADAIMQSTVSDIIPTTIQPGAYYMVTFDQRNLRYMGTVLNGETKEECVLYSEGDEDYFLPPNQFWPQIKKITGTYFR